MSASRQQFILRRLHSFTGVFPIGVYLIFHIMLANASVLGGPASFDAAVQQIAAVPPALLLGIEIVVIYLPLLFHGLYGFVRVREASLETAVKQDWVGSYLYALQRLTGVIAFFFVLYHAATTRGAHYFAHAEIGYAFMNRTLSNPLVFSWYVVGVLASVFHFTNGLWTFCVTWGITVGERAQWWARAIAQVAFGVMGATSIAILMAFRS